MSAAQRRRVAASSADREGERPQKERLQKERLQKERLQKVLARCGIASRRACEDLIRQGRVTVNGAVARLGERVDLGRDAVKVDGRRVRAPTSFRYLLLNKPRGCVTTRSDPKGRPTVLDLVPTRLRKGLFPVGRLDFDSEGLLLLTNDGDFAQRIMHPRAGCPKLYEVKVKGEPTAGEIQRLRDGISLDGRRTARCEIERRRMPDGKAGGVNSWWSVRLKEGRTRQIRRMFERVGHPVQRLRRVAIGPLRDPKLRPGKCRELSEAELKRLLKVSDG